MSRLRYQASEALVNAVLPFLPTDATVKAVHQPPTQFSKYPELVALPQRAAKTYWAETPLCDANGDPVFDDQGRVVFLRGEEEGEIQLRAYSRNPITRENMEDGVTAAFNMTSSPGVLSLMISGAIVPVGAVLTEDVPVSFKLQADEWREELVFSERRQSFITVYATIPILVAREVDGDGNNAITTQINICISQDTTTDISQLPTAAERLEALEPLDTFEVT